jgi:hypothetical protein
MRAATGRSQVRQLFSCQHRVVGRNAVIMGAWTTPFDMPSKGESGYASEENRVRT